MDFGDYKVKLATSEEKGRHVVATGDFVPGDIVFTCKPSVFALQRFLNKVQCSNCFVNMEMGDAMQCSACKREFYCSAACQKAHWSSNHKYECKKIEVLDKVPPQEATDFLLVSRALRMAKKDEAFKTKLFSLVNHSEEKKKIEKMDEIRKRIAENVVKYGFVDEKDFTQEEIVNLLCAFECNNFGIVNELFSIHGSGVYLEGAMVNHSCIPNTIMSYEPLNHTQIFRAIADIKSGEEIVHSYVELSFPTPRRQQELKVVYNFECTCDRCNATEEEKKGDGKFAVESYFSSLNPNLAKQDLTEEEKKKLVELLHQGRYLIQKSEEHLRKQETEEYVKLLNQGVYMLATVLHPFNAEYIHWVDAMSNFMLTQLAFSQGAARLVALQKAGVLTRVLLNAYEAWYPKYHPSIGMKRLVLAEILINLGHDEEEVKKMFEEAQKEVAITHGKDSSVLRPYEELHAEAQENLAIAKKEIEVMKAQEHPSRT
eukprot:TRINITY_DN89_c0_g1_i4.p1 TRINITY_DN89_c0_g1~~TRINITY_DN89_c0_g1_i4.p1  ORF type:complete len:485 (-),score=167.06 TRINITY_DN89_c0_g1_i4:469-1923(-)